MTTHSVDRPVVGFIGLGDQGLAMAVAIAEAGFAVHAWARSPRVFDDPLLGAFSRQATATELAAAVDLVAICVSTDEAVLDLAASMMPAMRRGAIFVNHGTGTPANAVALAALGARHGVHVIDAPVSGGRPGAEAHSLTTLAGGEESAVRAARPVFETFSARIVHLGPAGAGQRAKLFNNALMLMNMHAIADILTLAKDTGIYPRAGACVALGQRGQPRPRVAGHDGPAGDRRAPVRGLPARHGDIRCCDGRGRRASGCD
jgi:3-hydroxyisobutyrate dehydrogenase-like beta-hydroxyacid dehydrogenase